MSHLNGLHLVSIGTIVSFLWTIFKCISYTIFLSNWSLHCSQNRSLIVLDSRWVEKLLDSVDDSNSFFIKGSSLIWISSCKWFTGDFGNIFGNILLLALNLGFQDTDKPNFLQMIIDEEIKSFGQLFLVSYFVFVLFSISRFPAPTTCYNYDSK